MLTGFAGGFGNLLKVAQAKRQGKVQLALAREQFDVGNLYLNRPITGALVGRQPFGGHRLSGVGAKAGGEDYLMQFVVTRIISEQTLRRGFAPTE